MEIHSLLPFILKFCTSRKPKNFIVPNQEMFTGKIGDGTFHKPMAPGQLWEEDREMQR